MNEKEELNFLRRLVKDVLVQSKISYGYNLKNIDNKFNEVEKALKKAEAFDLVFNKDVHLYYIHTYGMTLEEYNKQPYIFDECKLTQEEYDLLKEVLYVKTRS